MLINILRDMEAKHLKSAAIYDRDSEEHAILSIEAYFRTFLQYAETKGFKLTEFEQTLRRKDEATGNYISVGYIQHWDCCPTHTMAIILSIEGKFHSVSIDKIRVICPKTKNINRRNLTPI